MLPGVVPQQAASLFRPPASVAEYPQHNAGPKSASMTGAIMYNSIMSGSSEYKQPCHSRACASGLQAAVIGETSRSSVLCFELACPLLHVAPLECLDPGSLAAKQADALMLQR